MLRNILNKVKQYRQASLDADLGRKLVGLDRSDGYELKRECEYVNVFHQNHPNTMDPAWEDWLRKKRLNPYTPEEMTKIYRYTDNLRNKGVAADKYEQEMMNTFRRSDKYNQAEKKDFQPENWDFENNKSKKQ